jgi:hypothetical protein
VVIVWIYSLVSWQLMALLLLRHALSLTNADGEDDASTFFSVSKILVFEFKNSTCCTV